ncbi:MAG TPA: type III secretion system cytoplasmic ring protein SctQ [Polyangia bacterium]|jgi:type III secretion system YscQ/HrcQ family protein
MKAAQPFRWDLLSHVGGPQLAVARAVAALAGASAAGLARQTAALARLLGAAPRVTLGPAAVVPRVDVARVLGTAPQPLAVLARDHRRALLALDPHLALALCGRVLGLGEELGLPRALTAAEEGVLALVLLTFLQAGDGGVQLAAVEQDPARVDDVFADPWVAVLPATVTLGEISGQARLLFPESTLFAAAPPPPARGLALVAELAARAAVEIGRGLLPGASVRALAPGDVVFLDGLAVTAAAGGPARLVAGRLAAPATLAPDGRLTVTGTPTIGAPMPASPDPTLVTHEERLAALDIEVVAEIGRVTLPGRELAALAPGAVVALGRPLGGPVDLLVGGRLLARGELVDVDGEIGVRVTEVVGG